MAAPETYSFRRYLEAKRTVDERALDGRVTARLRRELRGRPAPLRVLEAGVGIGATVERLAGWVDLPATVEYTAVDADADLLDAARERLTGEAASPTFDPAGEDGHLVAREDGPRVGVDLVEGDVFEVVRSADRPWDLVVAQAFLDLYDVRAALDRLWPAVGPGGLLYLPITFDGGTVFEPPVDAALDDAIERRYHAHLDGDLGPGDGRGDSRAGRHLLSALPAVGGSILAAGGSDWVVVPAEGGYPADEAYFLHHIVETIREALAGDPGLDADRFERWVGTRRRQIEDGELRYIAHQLDILARRPD